eukprot:1136144-Pelagomonas_calceolata.AAC.7
MYSTSLLERSSSQGLYKNPLNGQQIEVTCMSKLNSTSNTTPRLWAEQVHEQNNTELVCTIRCRSVGGRWLHWLPRIFLASMTSFMAGAELGGPCRQSSPQLVNSEVSGHFAQSLLCSPDTAELPSKVCFACTLSFRARGAQGGPGQPGVNCIGSQQT